MKSPGKMTIVVYLLGLAGIALFTALLICEGVGKVIHAFVIPIWVIAGIIAYHFIPIFLDTFAWWTLFPGAERPPLHRLFWMRWIGESISTLVPSVGVGGDIVRARLASIHGVPVATSAGTVIVDLTVGVFTQAVFTILGLLLLVHATGQTSFVGPTLFGTIVAVIAFVGFFISQRLGMFGFVGRLLSRMVRSQEWQSLAKGGQTLDEVVRRLYRRRNGLIGCGIATMISLTVACGEVWIALVAMKLNASFLNAFIFQSMAYTIRSAAFAVPSGIGVQEGGYIFVGNLLGIPGEAAFALSLVGRMRELGVGIPGLITWQLIEGCRLWRTRAAPTR